MEQFRFLNPLNTLPLAEVRRRRSSRLQTAASSGIPSRTLAWIVFAAMSLLPLGSFAQDPVSVLDRRAHSTEVIELLVTPSGLFPKKIEAPPGDYVLVIRRADFEAPVRLDLVASTGRKVTITAMDARARSRREVIRLRPGVYVASIFGSMEPEWTATIQVDPLAKERTSSN